MTNLVPAHAIQRGSSETRKATYNTFSYNIAIDFDEVEGLYVITGNNANGYSVNTTAKTLAKARKIAVKHTKRKLKK